MAKDEDPHWIEHMRMDKGALRRETHTADGKPIDAKKMHEAATSKNKTEQHRVEVAETLERLAKK